MFYDQVMLARGYSLQELDQVVATMVGFTNTALATSGVLLTLHVSFAGVFDRPLAGLDTYSAFAVVQSRSHELRDSFLRTRVCLGAAPSNGLECLGGGGTCAHEVGHLFGAGHQRDATVGGWGGAFEFSKECAKCRNRSTRKLS